MTRISWLPSAKRAALACAAVAMAVGVAACGSSSKPTPLAVSVSNGSNGKFVMRAPTKIKGGAVEMTFTNKSKAPGDAQLALIKGNHSFKDVLKIISANNPKVPDWLRAEGGVGSIPPGKTGKATMVLPAGSYFIFDTGGGGSNGPPPATKGAYSQLTVEAGSGKLPSTPAKIVADEVGKDKFKWETSGLKVGANDTTFVSKGKKTLHIVATFPVIGNPTDDQLKKLFASNGPPKGKPPLDFKAAQQSAVLDDGKSLTTTFNFPKPGKYAFVCFLSDRDGGKPHFEEGLLKQVTIK